MNFNISIRSNQADSITSVVHGNCIQVMQQLNEQSVDFILTDPPYLVNYRDRSGRAILNDVDQSWLKPAFEEAYRVLRNGHFMVSFYSWTHADKFLATWRDAGFRVIGHLVFRKQYCSQSRFLGYQHEQAYLLAKGHPPLPAEPISDVVEMRYSGNQMHPTQKPVSALIPLIRAFTKDGDLVLDPFCGSGSTGVAALLTGRKFLGIELDSQYHRVAQDRLARRIAGKRVLITPVAQPSCP
jgi:site-specific DNA-methyltransferase (adenine-specific)